MKLYRWKSVCDEEQMVVLSETMAMATTTTMKKIEHLKVTEMIQTMDKAKRFLFVFFSWLYLYLHCLCFVSDGRIFLDHSGDSS